MATLNPEQLHTIPSGAYNNVISKVNDVNAQIRDQATGLFARGTDLTNAAQTAVDAIVNSLVDVALGPVPQSPTLEPMPTAPVISVTANTQSAPDIGTLPTFLAPNTTYTPGATAIPAAPTDTPSLNIPSPPQVTIPGAPSKPALPVLPTIPNAPTLGIPSAPTIAGVTLPTLPTVTLPTYDVGLLPEWTEPPPNIRDIWASVPVSVNDSFLQAFGAMAQDTTPATLTTVYTQDATRQADAINKQAAQDIEAVTDDAAARGFTAPSGALAKRTDSIRAVAAAQVRTVNRDLALARLQSELDVYRANIAAGVELAKTQIDKDLQIARLTLDIVTASVRAAIDTYNALVEVFKAKQMAAQTAADVYRAQLQGEISKVDLYAKQVEAQKVGVDVSVAQMQGYEAEVRGVLAKVDIYRAQVEGAKAQIEAQAATLGLFRGEIDAYVAQVNGARAVYDAYDSQVRGAIAPVQLYEARMRGYSASVDGARAAVDAERVRAALALKHDELALQAYTTSVDAVIKQGQVRIETVRANAAVEQSRLAAIETQARSAVAAYQGQIEATRAQNQVAVAAYETAVKGYEVVGRLNQEKVALRVEAAKGAAQVSSQLAASALAGLHVQESISSSANIGAALSSSGSWSYGINESHQFSNE